MTKSNELVTVPFGEDPSEQATKLLAAAESEGFGPGVVRSDTGGTEPRFVVPKSVAQVALGKNAKGVEKHEDPFENVQSGETVSAYPQQGAEAEIGQDGAKASEAPPQPEAPEQPTMEQAEKANPVAAQSQQAEQPKPKKAAKKAPAKKAAKKSAAKKSNK